MNWYTGIVLYEIVERWHELRRRWSNRGEGGHVEGLLYVVLVVFVVLAILVLLGKL